MRRRATCCIHGVCGRIACLAWDRYNAHFLRFCSDSTLPPHAGDVAVGVNAAETTGVSGEGTAPGGDFSARLGGAESDPLPKLYSSGAFPFKLYGEDSRAFVNDSNRMFSSSTFSSHDPAVIVEEEMARNASNSALIDTRCSFEEQMGQGQVTVASIAAATMAATPEVNKASDHAPSSVFQQPVVRPQHGADLANVSSHSVTGKKNDAVDACRGGGDKQRIFSTERRQCVVIEDMEVDEETEQGHSVNTEGDGEGRVNVRDHMRNPVSVERLTSFGDLANTLPRWLQNGIEQAGYAKPTLVQSVAIPLFMEKRDVVGVAPTGSGKTVAFALPALAALAALPSRGDGGPGVTDGGRSADGFAAVTPAVLVLCPTRELVQQTRRVFAHLAGGAVRVKGTFGGQERERQLDHLRRWGGCDVLVSTPGRLCDFLETGAVGVGLVDFLIMDEADRMLELGFAPQLEFIMSNIRKHKRPRQTTMWTATWNATVGSLASRFLQAERVLLEVDREHKINTNIEQRLYALQDASQRIQAIVKLYDDGVILKRQQVLIFVNRKEEVERLADDLTRALRAPPDLIKPLHGGMKQNKREAIVRDFRENHIRILCATDVAARGLDVPKLDHVINYDLPRDTDAYVHRIGRTGRAGRQGTAHTLIVAGDGRVPRITRFIAEWTRAELPDDVLAIVRDVELHPAAAERSKYRDHAHVAGRDWRLPGGEAPSLAKSSRFVRGVGRVVTLKRPLKD